MQEDITQRKLISEKEAASRYGVSIRFFQARRLRGNGPPFVRVSARCVRYSIELLDRWFQERTANSTSDSLTCKR